MVLDLRAPPMPGSEGRNSWAVKDVAKSQQIKFIDLRSSSPVQNERARRGQRAVFYHEVTRLLEENGLDSRLAERFAHSMTGRWMKEEERQQRLRRFAQNGLFSLADAEAVESNNISGLDAASLVSRVRENLARLAGAGVRPDKAEKVLGLGYSFDAVFELAREAGKPLRSFITFHILGHAPVGRMEHSEKIRLVKGANRGIFEEALRQAGFTPDEAAKIFLALRGYGLTTEEKKEKRFARFVTNRYIREEAIEAMRRMDRLAPEVFREAVKPQEFAWKIMRNKDRFVRDGRFTAEEIHVALINGYSYGEVVNLAGRFGKKAATRALRNPDALESLKERKRFAREAAAAHHLTVSRAAFFSEQNGSDAKLRAFLERASSLGLSGNDAAELFLKYRLSPGRVAKMIRELAVFFVEIEKRFIVAADAFSGKAGDIREEMVVSGDLDAVEKKLSGLKTQMPTAGITDIVDTLGHGYWVVYKVVLSTFLHKDKHPSRRRHKTVYRPLLETSVLFGAGLDIVHSRDLMFQRIKILSAASAGLKKQITAERLLRRQLTPERIGHARRELARILDRDGRLMGPGSRDERRLKFPKLGEETQSAVFLLMRRGLMRPQDASAQQDAAQARKILLRHYQFVILSCIGKKTAGGSIFDEMFSVATAAFLEAAHDYFLSRPKVRFETYISGRVKESLKSHRSAFSGFGGIEFNDRYLNHTENGNAASGEFAGEDVGDEESGGGSEHHDSDLSVWQAIEQMPEDLRYIILGRYVDGEEVGDLAKKLGIPVEEAAEKERAALAFLRRLMEEAEEPAA